MMPGQPSSTGGLFKMVEARFPGDPLPLIEIKVNHKSHITLRDTRACLSCVNKPCTYICPSQVYEWEEDNIKINYPRCVECGACMKVCPKIMWEYPPGGYGIIYRY